MRVMLTGATGFLGRRLSRRLVAEGHEVACLLRAESRSEGLETAIASYRVDESGDGLRDAFAAHCPEVTVHLAAHFVAEHHPTDVVPLIRANVEYGARILDAMTAEGCHHLVWAGSAWQHFHDRAYCPVNLYAATKQAFSSLAEYYVDACDLRLLELHLYDSYGEGDPRSKLLSLIKSAAINAVNIDMSEGNQRIHLVHVDDLAHGFVLAAEQVRAQTPGSRQVFRLPSAQAVSLRELVGLFNRLHPQRPVQVRWGQRPARTREVAIPWEDAPILPGWQPGIDLADGLTRLMADLPEGHP